MAGRKPKIVVIEEYPVTKEKRTPLKTRNCPDCGGFLFLESVDGEEYWWSCLMCGWHKAADGVEPLVMGRSA